VTQEDAVQRSKPIDNPPVLASKSNEVGLLRAFGACVVMSWVTVALLSNSRLTSAGPSLILLPFPQRTGQPAAEKHPGQS